LGKNDLALQAYRRAMKVAFADVISVKNKLGVKKSQESLDSITADLTREEEQHFELSLLKVASRVADIHNNMGVVHEMNRQYEKARSSYMDALEVYHNTCKRFEEKGDPDVDRTKKNVERMTLACNSEQQRRALHEKAMGIAKRLEREAHSDIRKNLLNEVVATLRRALDLESETIGLTHPVAAGTLIQIGKYHYEMREYDSAVLEIRQAITIYRNALGGNHPQVGKSTLLLASIFDRHGLHISPQGTCKDDSELELYVDALEPLKATLGEVHAEIGFLYAKIGYLYGKKGDLSLSLLAYKASLKSHGEPSSNKNNLEVMSIWVRITENLTGLKLWDEVLVAGRRALYLLRCSRNALFATGSASASSSANTTSQPRGTTTKKSQIRITSDTYYTSLFSTLQSLGHAHTSLSNYALARDACSESLQLAWEMALSTSKAHSENEALAISVTRVIRALKRLGKAYLLEKHYAPALECFLPSLELLRSSKEMESTLDCASVLGSLGFLYLKLKKYAESSNFLRECLRLYHENGEFQE
jgi:tetratricopeptide (TPR) repeat protein